MLVVITPRRAASVLSGQRVSYRLLRIKGKFLRTLRIRKNRKHELTFGIDNNNNNDDDDEEDEEDEEEEEEEESVFSVAGPGPRARLVAVAVPSWSAITRK